MYQIVQLQCKLPPGGGDHNMYMPRSTPPVPKPFTCSPYELTHSPTQNHAEFLASVQAIMVGVGFWGDPYIGLRVKCW